MSLTDAQRAYIATEPPMDGWIEVWLINPINGNNEFHHDLEELESWMDSTISGLAIRYPRDEKTQRSRVIVYPWSNLSYYEVFENSAAYVAATLKWLRDCDHDWLSHPQFGNYCRVCRLNMNNLDYVLNPDTKDIPQLHTRSDAMDAACEKLSGRDPHAPKDIPTMMVDGSQDFIAQVSQDPDDDEQSGTDF